MGRRPGLAASAPAEVVRAWIRDAIEHLDEMEYTCSLDVADNHPDGYPLGSLAELLGVTPAAIKSEVACAGELRQGLAAHEDHVPHDRAGNLAHVIGAW